jgi:hypothetical protein
MMSSPASGLDIPLLANISSNLRDCIQQLQVAAANEKFGGAGESIPERIGLRLKDALIRFEVRGISATSAN